MSVWMSSRQRRPAGADHSLPPRRGRCGLDPAAGWSRGMRAPPASTMSSASRPRATSPSVSNPRRRRRRTPASDTAAWDIMRNARSYWRSYWSAREVDHRVLIEEPDWRQSEAAHARTSAPRMVLWAGRWCSPNVCQRTMSASSIGRSLQSPRLDARPPPSIDQANSPAGKRSAGSKGVTHNWCWMNPGAAARKGCSDA